MPNAWRTTISFQNVDRPTVSNHPIENHKKDYRVNYD